MTGIINLSALERQADAWLLALRTDRALCPCEIQFFRKTFCIPWPLEIVQPRDESLADFLKRMEEDGDGV
jgi:hypothetical protein